MCGLPLYSSCMALICSRALEGLLQLVFVHRWAAADRQSRLTRRTTWLIRVQLPRTRNEKSRLVTYLLRLDRVIIIILGRVLLGDGRERPADRPDVRVRQIALPSSFDGGSVDPAVGPLS